MAKRRSNLGASHAQHEDTARGTASELRRALVRAGKNLRGDRCKLVLQDLRYAEMALGHLSADLTAMDDVPKSMDAQYVRLRRGVAAIGSQFQKRCMKVK